MSESNGSNEYKLASVPTAKEFTEDDLALLMKENAELRCLWDFAKEMPRGQVIPYKEVYQVIGLPKEDRACGKVIKLWKDLMLWIRGIEVGSGGAKGYKLMTTQEQLFTQTDKVQARFERDSRKRAVTIGAVKTDELSDHERNFQFHRASQMFDLAGKINSQRAQALIWAKRPDQMPRVNGPS